MKLKTIDYLVIIGGMLLVGFMGVLSGIEIGKMTVVNEIETTTAKPIYQQQIGDEAEPDILIIYEAEVDGVKVYPSVIKEAK